MSVFQLNTLIRDKIPEILTTNGKTPVVESLPEEQFVRHLYVKLLELVNEYVDSGNTESLVDIGEVMHALLAYHQIPVEEFQQMRLQKLKDYGGFEQRLLLKTVTEN